MKQGKKETVVYHPLSIETERVLALKEHFGEHWKDRDNSYWCLRLMQEVGELASVIAGDHHHTKEHELRQIASIALNMLDKIHEQNKHNE